MKVFAMTPISDISKIYASFFQRSIAWIIDSFIIGLCGYSVINNDENIIINTLIQLIPISYFLIFWTFRGATPGMIIMKIRVVNEKDLKNITFTQGAVRYLGLLLSAILMLGFIWILFDKKNKGFHDYMANTIVVKNKEFSLFENEIKEAEHI